MAGSIFTSFGAGDANATAFMTHLTAMTKGYNALSLTNMDNTTVPAIAAGSLIENNGALFKFDAEDSISTTDPVTSTTVADGTVYIMLVPSGSTISACFTATAPTWSDSKQGWYGTTIYANNRYIEYILYKSSSEYKKTKKIKYFTRYRGINASYSSGTHTNVFVSSFLTYDLMNNRISDTVPFKASKSGIYKIRLAGYNQWGGEPGSFGHRVYINGTTVLFSSGSGFFYTDISGIFFLNGGDEVKHQLSVSGSYFSLNPIDLEVIEV